MSDWKFETEEVGEEAEPDPEEFALEPGSPSKENAFFVVLGVAMTLFLFAHAILAL